MHNKITVNEKIFVRRSRRKTILELAKNRSVSDEITRRQRTKRSNQPGDELNTQLTQHTKTIL